jgi:hypothetical protein
MSPLHFGIVLISMETSPSVSISTTLKRIMSSRSLCFHTMQVCCTLSSCQRRRSKIESRWSKWALIFSYVSYKPHF